MLYSVQEIYDRNIQTINTLKPGDLCDAMHKEKKWKVSQVLDVIKENTTLVVGVGKKKEEWYFSKQDLKWIAQLHFHTQGPFVSI